MGEAQVLLHDVNPNGNLEAIVEDDDKTIYLYVAATGGLERDLRPVWLRNLGPAPLSVDRDAMAEGSAPKLTAPFCKFPQGGLPRLRAEELRVSWTEDGDGLFLLERDELLAVVPSWTPLAEGGWSRDASRDSSLASALTPERLADAKARLARAEAFWARWSEAEAWPAFRDPELAVLEAALGPTQRSFAPRGSGWPPRELRTFLYKEAEVAITLGGALRPQPGVEAAAPELAPRLRRIELGFAAEAEVGAELLTRVWQYQVAQLGYPWSALSWVGNGHTLPCDAFGEDAAFSSVLLLSAPSEAPRIELPAVEGEPVNLLWMVPITEGERAFAREHGSARLVERLKAAGVTWMFRPRAEVPLQAP